MRDNQSFVWGMDLKLALQSINSHFLQLPEAEREKGILSFAKSPPNGNIVTDLWDRFVRKGFRDEEPVKIDPMEEAALVARLKAFNRQPRLRKGEAEGHRVHEVSTLRTFFGSVFNGSGFCFGIPVCFIGTT
jgi:hypothetical protein